MAVIATSAKPLENTGVQCRLRQIDHAADASGVLWELGGLPPRTQSVTVAGGIGKSILQWPVQVEAGAKNPREPQCIGTVWSAAISKVAARIFGYA